MLDTEEFDKIISFAREAAKTHFEYKLLPFKIGDKVMAYTSSFGCDKFVPATIKDIILGYNTQNFGPELVITIQYEDKRLGERKVIDWRTDIKIIS